MGPVVKSVQKRWVWKAHFRYTVSMCATVHALLRAVKTGNFFAARPPSFYQIIHSCFRLFIVVVMLAAM